MKKSILFLFCFFLIKKTFANDSNFSTINIIISSKFKPKINYYTNINGFSTVSNRCLINSIVPKKIKKQYLFELKLENKDVEFIKFEIYDDKNEYVNITNHKNEFLNDIYVLANKGDNIKIDLNLIDSTLEFYNDNAQGLKLLQKQLSYPNLLKIEDFINNFINKKLFLVEFDNYLLNIKQNIEKFLENKSITQAFLNSYNKTVSIFLLNQIIKKLNDNENNKIKSIDFTERFNIKNDLLNKYPVEKNDFKLFKGDEIYETINDMNFKYKNFNFNYSDSVIYFNNNLYYIKPEFKKYLYFETNKSIKENCYALNLLYSFSTIHNRFDTNDIIVFDLLFPKSKWLKYIINSYNLYGKAVYESRCGFLTTDKDTLFYKQILPINFLDENKFNTVEKIIKNYKNKLIFIDLWATWCTNCISEFKYNSIIDSLFKMKDVEKIYISLDNISQKDKWKKIINQFKLGGHHIIANDKIKEEIKVLLNNNVFLPRYLLFDKNGKLIADDALRPSNPKLIELIDKNL